MRSVVFSEVQFGRLLRTSLSFERGLFVMTGAEHEGLAEIITLISGLEHPTRGSVRVLETDPYRTPETRRNIALLLPDAEPLAAPKVSDSAALALKLGRHAQTAETALARAGLSALADRRTASLNYIERQSLALALALAHDSPKVIALYEPLSVTPDFRQDYLHERLNSFVEQGALALVATGRSQDAHAFDGSHVSLVRGEILRGTGEGLDLGECRLRVVTNDPRKLAEQLFQTPNISAALVRQVSDLSGELEVRGRDLETVALAVMQAAEARSLNIHAIEAALPSVEELYAARLGAQRAAYERAYSARSVQLRPLTAPVPNVTPPPRVFAPTAPSPTPETPETPQVPRNPGERT